MWKRLSSNRDPRATLWREIRYEFDGPFRAMEAGVRQLTSLYPRLLFGLMISTLLTSVILSLTLLRHPGTVPPVPVPPSAQIRNGLSQLQQATRSIKQTLLLKHMVDSLAAKQNLSAGDSSELDSALTQLEAMRHLP